MHNCRVSFFFLSLVGCAICVSLRVVSCTRWHRFNRFYWRFFPQIDSHLSIKHRMNSFKWQNLAPEILIWDEKEKKIIQDRALFIENMLFVFPSKIPHLFLILFLLSLIWFDAYIRDTRNTNTHTRWGYLCKEIVKLWRWSHLFPKQSLPK